MTDFLKTQGAYELTQLLFYSALQYHALFIGSVGVFVLVLWSLTRSMKVLKTALTGISLYAAFAVMNSVYYFHLENTYEQKARDAAIQSREYFDTIDPHILEKRHNIWSEMIYVEEENQD